MSPVIPHFASECLANLNTKIIEEIKWPNINQSILEEDKINFVIQINGKKRGILNLNKNIEKSYILKKINDDEKLQNFIKNKEIKNTIFIPNKLINIIVKN